MPIQQHMVPPFFADLSVTCLNLVFWFDDTTFDTLGEATSLVDDVVGAIVGYSPTLQYVHLKIEAATGYDKAGRLSFQSEETWWKIRRYEENGKIRAVADSIPQWVCEGVMDRVEKMDYQSLSGMNPEELV